MLDRVVRHFPGNPSSHDIVCALSQFNALTLTSQRLTHLNESPQSYGKRFSPITKLAFLKLSLIGEL